MEKSDLLRWQWEGYPRFHRSRSNLVLHILVVPIFLVCNVALLRFLIELSWLGIVASVAGMGLSVALQGRGHQAEDVPPEPFTGPGDALRRIFVEQWITFPRFVLSGGWLRALRGPK